MEKLLEKYDAISALILVGKELTKEDYDELRQFATEVNKNSKAIEFDVNGSDSELLDSIKQYIRAALERD